MCEDLAKDVPAECDRLRVIVVEDDPFTAKTLATLLKLWGHAPQLIAEGQEVLQSVEENRPDVILLDLDRSGMDGLEIAKWVRKRHMRSPPMLIATTNFDTTDDRNRSNAVGIDLPLLKPLDPAALQAVL